VLILTLEMDHLFKTKLSTSENNLELNRFTSHPNHGEDSTGYFSNCLFHSARASPVINLLSTTACPLQSEAQFLKVVNIPRHIK